MPEIRIEFRPGAGNSICLESDSFLIGKARATISVKGFDLPLEIDMRKVTRVEIDYGSKEDA